MTTYAQDTFVRETTVADGVSVAASDFVEITHRIGGAGFVAISVMEDSGTNHPFIIRAGFRNDEGQGWLIASGDHSSGNSNAHADSFPGYMNNLVVRIENSDSVAHAYTVVVRTYPHVASRG